MRPSRSDLIALLALFVALGGASYAAIKLPAKSVGAKQLKKNAVTSKKVKDGALRAKDFKAGELPAGAKGETGAQGPQGVPGADGEDFRYSDVFVVKAAGTDSENGQALLDAVAQVNAREAGERSLIWLEPGRFTVPAPLVLNNRTVLAGSGRTVTTIEATGLANVITGGREVRDVAIDLEAPVGQTVALQGENAFDTDYRHIELDVSADNAGVTSVIGIRTRGFGLIDDADVSVNTVSSSATATTGILVTNGARQWIRSTDVIVFSLEPGIALDLEQDARVDDTRLRAQTNGLATALRTVGGSAPLVVVRGSKLQAQGAGFPKSTADEATGRITIVDSELEGNPANGPACVDSWSVDYGVPADAACTLP